MGKATDFINTRCYQLGNPVQPLVFKTDALEAVRIASKEIEERATEVYKNLCPCYQNGKCKHYPHNKRQGMQICDMECEYIRLFKNKLVDISINEFKEK